jgi:Dolichyl-phosphate-mannose-protein mannosyltransferase
MPKLPHLLLLFFFALFLHSLGNSTLPLIDRDEPRFAEASREMQQSGDYLIPRINGDFRFDKPPLIYWCQAAAFNLLGDNDFAARLPSVLFAAATAVATALWGGRIFGPRTGLCAGLHPCAGGRGGYADGFLFSYGVLGGLGKVPSEAKSSYRSRPTIHSAKALVDILPVARAGLPGQRSNRFIARPLFTASGNLQPPILSS